MKIAPSDLADRFSILLLKKNRGNLPVDEELNAIEIELNKYNPSIWFYVGRLSSVNGKIWDLESDIRFGKEGKIGLEEVGRRALKIRDHNNERIQIKNEIANKFNEGFIEVKKDHGSE